MNSDIKLLKKFINESLLIEDENPGGAITPNGAERVINPTGADGEVRDAMNSTKGNVKAAARRLKMSIRNLYRLLQTRQSLRGVKTASEKETEVEEREEAKKKQRRKAKAQSKKED